jgi:uncharacterized protein (TIGR03067 family)
VEGKKFTLTCKQLTLVGSFTINPSTTPNMIDVVIRGDNGQDSMFLGIYEIKGDTRRSCFAMPGTERPTRLFQDGCIGFEWKLEATPQRK